MTWINRVWVLAAVALAAVGPGVAGAQPPATKSLNPDEPPTAFMAQRRGGVSLAQATAMARNRYHGQVVKAETVARGDRVIHEIRILGEDGKVRTVRIDAQTGMFL